MIENEATGVENPNVGRRLELYACHGKNRMKIYPTCLDFAVHFLQFFKLSGVSGKKLMRGTWNRAETGREFFMPELEPISGGEVAQPEVTSLGNRLMNVFVSPSEVFDEVKVSPPNAANWWVPLTLIIIAGIVFAMVVFSQPGVIQGM